MHRRMFPLLALCLAVMVSTSSVAQAPAILFLPVVTGGSTPTVRPTYTRTPTATATNTPTTRPTSTRTPDPRLIVFTSTRDGNQEVYIINADGSNEKRLTDHPGHDWGASISPDHSKIVFLSQRAWATDLYTMDLDGSSLRRLTYSGVDREHPFWSADGARVLYVRNGALWSVNLDGSNEHLVASTGGLWCYLAPDESKLAYMAHSGDGDIHVLTIDGLEDVGLAEHPAHDANPRWSPDSLYVVFESYRDWSWDLYVVGVDDSGLRKLTNTSRTIGDGGAVADWSPDGSRIVYYFPGTPWKGIYTVDPQGTNHSLLIANGHGVQWYPDGKSLVYASSIGGSQQICVADADGSNQHQLTTSPGDNFGPSWAWYQRP